MLIIQKEQLDVFRSHALNESIDRLQSHMCKHFRWHHHVLGDADIRSAIFYGITRAENHGFLTEREIFFFLNLTFMFGSHFDEDPQLPWAIEILTDRNLEGSVLRIRALFDAGIDFSRRIAGENGEHIIHALNRMKHLDLILENQRRSQYVSNIDESEAFFLRAFSALQEIYPEKCLELGEATIRLVCRLAQQRCKHFGINNGNDVAIFIIFAFFLGSKFDSDPLVSWAGNILNDTSIKDSRVKVAKLRSIGEATLHQWFLFKNE